MSETVSRRSVVLGDGLRWLIAVAVVFVVMVGMAPVAQAAGPAFTPRIDFPDTAVGGPDDTLPGQEGQRMKSIVAVENSGSATMSGMVTITVTLPPEMRNIEVFFSPGGPEGTCDAPGQVITCTLSGDAMRPDAKTTVWMISELSPDVTGEVTVPIEFSGGGVAEPVQIEETITIGPPNPFGVSAFSAAILDADDEAETQAGAAPDSATNGFKMPTYASEVVELPIITTLLSAVSGQTRNIVVHTPAGMTANFNATPIRCTAAQLGAISGSGEVIPGKTALQMPLCPFESQVGIAYVFASYVVPVYAMETPPGVAAQFGFAVTNVPVTINARLRPSDSGVDLVTSNISTTIPLDQVEVSLWGVPGDPSHDTLRPECLTGEVGHNSGPDTCPIDTPRKAFLRLPTSCAGPLRWGTEIDSYEEPGVFHAASTTTPAQVGCNQLEFTPTVDAKPSTNVADSPSGLDLHLHLPQNEDPDGLAQAHVKDVALKLPQGLTVNSASADGLGACSPAQIGLLSPVGQTPAQFNGAQPQCPDASKLGSVLVNTPAVDHVLPGTIYLASQGQNPYGSLLALYLVINDPDTGIVIKIPIRADLDPDTGRVTTTVASSPQQPFEDLTIELDKGAHAPLRTPIACGKFTTATDMTPWSSPEGQDAHPSDNFEVTRGAGGGSCVRSAAQAPFAPTFSAGTLEPKAGAFSPYSIKISRADGTQELGSIDLKLPRGLLANLRGIPYCTDGALASVPTALGTGADQAVHPSCPLASQIGSVSAAVGAGPSPLNVTTGKAYWAGPYKGAPVSMAVIFPAVAGPFDLGNVVVRTGFYVDPETAEITAKSDPLPSMLKGIPLDIRTVRINLDRPNYGLNPTSCDPMSIEADLSSNLGASVHRSERFQVGGCNDLAFKPKLGLRLSGGTKRSKYPGLTATLTFPKKLGANTAKASVALPPSEFLAQNHIRTICTRVQFAADSCPSQSIYGYARAYSPILDYYLAGPVYLRSSDHELPDLVADLNGQIEIALVGRIDQSKEGGIRTTFESVPDAPVSKFVLKMQGGKKGLLQNSVNLCRGKHRATALFEAHNGMSLRLRPELRAPCGKKGKKKQQRGTRGY